MGDIFLENPLSYGIVKWHSQKYIEETYPDLQLRIDDVYHDWYNGGGCDVSASSVVSRDTQFKLIYDRLEWDDYESTVASGRNTSSWLYREYVQKVHDALSPLNVDFVCMPGWPP